MSLLSHMGWVQAVLIIASEDITTRRWVLHVRAACGVTRPRDRAGFSKISECEDTAWRDVTHYLCLQTSMPLC